MIAAFQFIQRYANWLHLRWPSGTVEKLPEVFGSGKTNVKGLYVVGDLSGIPLLKFASDSAAKAVRTIHADPEFQRLKERHPEIPYEVLIIGCGPAGLSAAVEAKKFGLTVALIESNAPFSTVADIPAKKPIFLYPMNWNPRSEVQYDEASRTQPGLLQFLHAEIARHGFDVISQEASHVERSGDFLEVVLSNGERRRALRVIAAMGRTGAYRKLDVPGEDLPHVHHQLFDPAPFAAKKIVVVGGGDTALETADLLADVGADVTLVHRGADFARAKSENIESVERRRGPKFKILFNTRVREIGSDRVEVSTDSQKDTVQADAVFLKLGRHASLTFFRRSRVKIRGEWSWGTWIGLAAFLSACVLVFHWKSFNRVLPLYQWFESHQWFPFSLAENAQLQGSALVRALLRSMSEPAFYYTVAYSIVVFLYGLRRMRDTTTQYVQWQTWTLIAIQVVPLFVLPEILLPWAGERGWFLNGTSGGNFADLFFESYDQIGVDRAYWRSYGLILAWPLFIWNFFTEKPMWAWLVVGLIQTFVLIPWMVWKWGKGAYCGWICSCGALAETLGDRHRHKMPHGAGWNRLNMLGQGILALALILFVLRCISWLNPGGAVEKVFWGALTNVPVFHYSWFVDLFLSGILGIGLYFWFSGRTWCRFACPLAALMHIYARFSKFRIFSNKEKCISCNECTRSCHQGIDVMAFAQRGLPMADPQCVRCSACITVCPTDVLRFGTLESSGPVHDRLSPRQEEG